jgi:hypothetical protein
MPKLPSRFGEVAQNKLFDILPKVGLRGGLAKLFQCAGVRVDANQDSVLPVGGIAALACRSAGAALLTAGGAVCHVVIQLTSLW